MENEFIHEVSTTAPEPTAPQPAAQPVMTPKQPVPRIWLIAAAVIMIGLVGLFIANRLLNPPETPGVPVVEAPTSTPTPIRILSTIATQSAFMALAQSHASLSAGLAATNLDDPSLSPPVLDLPLGFR